MATLTVTTIDRSGEDIAGAAATSGGDNFANDGAQFYIVKNGDVGSHNVTFATQATLDGEAVADLTIAVGAGVTKMIGPFPPSIYNDSDGLVQVTYSAVTSVTVKAVKCVPA